MPEIVCNYVCVCVCEVNGSAYQFAVVKLGAAGQAVEPAILSALLVIASQCTPTCGHTRQHQPLAILLSSECGRKELVLRAKTSSPVGTSAAGAPSMFSLT